MGDRMFFFAIMGTDQKRENIGSIPFNCGKCNTYEDMIIFKDYNYFHIFFLPIFKFSAKYEGYCKKCGSEFYIDNEIGKLLDKGLITHLDSSSIHLKQQFNTYSSPVCPYCKNFIDEDDVYCRKCGKKL